MKKLMTMIAAVAMSFGLFADDAALNAAFDASNIPAGPYTPSTDPGWATYSGASGTLNIVGDDQGANVLEIKTGSAELARYVATDGNAWEITNLYLEASIDFQEQALEDVPTNISTYDKLALFILDTSEIEGAPGTTNLFAMAGYGANGKALFNLGKVDEAWFADKKIAIKAYDNVFQGDNKRTGFLVSVANGTTVEPLTVWAVYPIDSEGAVSWTNAMGDDYLNLGEDIKLVSKVSKWAKQGDDYRKLLFSMAVGNSRNGKLTSVGFTGNAQIASVGFTETDPGFGSDSVGMPLDVTEGVTFALTQDSIDAGFETDGISTITGPASGDTFTFTVNKGGFDNVTVTLNTKIEPNDQGIYEAELTPSATLTVTGWNTAATVNGTPYPTLADAMVEANKGTEQKPASLVLAKGDTAAAISVTGVVVLDLHGETLSSTSENAAVIAVSSVNGNLTIVDSVGTGAIVNTDYGTVECGKDSVVRIEKGRYEGDVIDDGTVLALPGTAFLKGEEDYNTQAKVDGWAKAAGDYEAVSGEDELANYWVVQVAAPAIEYVTFRVSYEASEVENVTVTTNGETVVGVLNVYTVESNAVVTVAASPKADFKNVAITGDNVTVTDGEFTADKAESTITITADAMVYATVPAITDAYTYNGQVQTAVLTGGMGYEVVDNSDQQKDAGVHQVEVALASGYDAWDDDDSVTNKFITWTIDQAVATVRAVDQTIKVGESPATYTATVSPPAIGADVINYTVACPTYEDKEGTYDIVVTLGENPNYDLMPYNGTLKVEKAEDPTPPWVPEGEKEAYNTWKAGPGATESDFTGTEEEIAKKMEDSFLLNCAPTEAALKTAKDNFKISSITKDSSGNWVVLTVGQADKTEYGHGRIKLEAFEDVGCKGTPVTPGTQVQLFWKASLVHPTAN